jgi:hypothetical protein
VSSYDSRGSCRQSKPASVTADPSEAIKKKVVKRWSFREKEIGSATTRNQGADQPKLQIVMDQTNFKEILESKREIKSLNLGVKARIGKMEGDPRKRKRGGYKRAWGQLMHQCLQHSIGPSSPSPN